MLTIQAGLSLVNCNVHCIHTERETFRLLIQNFVSWFSSLGGSGLWDHEFSSSLDISLVGLVSSTLHNVASLDFKSFASLLQEHLEHVFKRSTTVLDCSASRRRSGKSGKWIETHVIIVLEMHIKYTVYIHQYCQERGTVITPGLGTWGTHKHFHLWRYTVLLCKSTAE